MERDEGRDSADGGSVGDETSTWGSQKLSSVPDLFTGSVPSLT